MARIYVSSTFSDLAPFREAVYHALRQAGHDVIAMEDYVAADARPLDKCLADVARCDLYVGLFAWRYGYVPTEDNSEGRAITELEYRHAEALGRPRLIHLLDPEVAWPRGFMDEVTGENEAGKRIQALRAELEKTRLFSHFREKEELARLVSVGVANWARKHDSAPAPRWDEPPFPGLRAFRPQEALIFFGREHETEELLAALADPALRLVVVVGASGSGKSSLVAAGLLPRLTDGALPGSRAWRWLRFTPGERGDDPFLALSYGVHEALPGLPQSARDLAAVLRASPEALTKLVDRLAPDGELLLFLDQLEELFTLVRADDIAPFLDLVCRLAGRPRLRVIATLRADFYARALQHEGLTALLRRPGGSFPLATPGVGALHAMITRPAVLAGLTVENDLPERILDGTGTGPGALALMAFTLRELWERGQHARALTHADYAAFGGVQGALERRAEETVEAVFPDRAERDAALAAVFRELVTVDEAGVATRKRALRAEVDTDPRAARLAQALADARLLVTGRGADNTPTIEVAHEGLLGGWPAFAEWIGQRRDALRLRTQIENAARHWAENGRLERYAWNDERVMEAAAVIARLGPDLSFSPTAREFLGPVEREVMLDLLADPQTNHAQRASIGLRLALLGDDRPGVGLRPDGVPDILWHAIPGGEVTLELKGGETRRFEVAPFHMARYPVTWRQYRAFIEAEDGYENPDWWPVAGPYSNPAGQRNRWDNHPVVEVNWYGALAFCRWLSGRLGYTVRLPTEWEWQQAATGGDPANAYPWGSEWEDGRANTYESQLGRATAVGCYPQGASAQGVEDLSGTVWEWCQNEYERPEVTDPGGDWRRVVRGGSWGYDRAHARAAFRLHNAPRDVHAVFGVRVVCSSPLFEH